MPAFPGAEGFGAGATGGRGCEVYEVTSLADAGAGSLRDAVSRGNRTIVFRVSGTINLQSRLTIDQPNITIAGQTAPGDGICLRGYDLFIANTENIIIRYLRIRPGDQSKTELDAVTIWTAKDVIMDHCSLSWSTDSLNDVVKESGNVTVQWCILSEPLNQSVHLKGKHGYATGWDGRTRGGGSFHHNLIAHAASRAPRIGYFKTGRGLIDCRNNVIYNSGPAYGGETDDLNYVGNYYRPGPTSFRPDGAIFHVSADDTRAYIAGNVFEGRPESAADNAAAVKFDGIAAMPLPNAGPNPGTNAAANAAPSTQPINPTGKKAGDAATCLVAGPFDVAPITTHPAEEAYELVVKRAGATSPKRDPVDERICSDVRNRTGKIIDSPSEVGGWPELKAAPAPVDADHDGMPDVWETAHQLNPADPSDGRAVAPGEKTYTNLEMYLNQLGATGG
ncbi:MAG: pectate lyase [Burkholderiales bacterium]|nr:pectate lyase [Phycisphaerae bacterium]